MAARGTSLRRFPTRLRLMGEKEKAIEWLTKTVEDPKTLLQTVNFNDPDFARIKDEVRFKTLNENVERKIHPCKYSEQAMRFAFFVGEWNARLTHRGS
jgi:hypothetical protein